MNSSPFSPAGIRTARRSGCLPRRMLVACMACLAGAASIAQPATPPTRGDFRGLSWGATSEQVRATETAEFVGGQMRPQRLIYSLASGHLPVLLIYELPRDRLERVTVSSRLAGSDCVLLFGGQGRVPADLPALRACNEDDTRARYADAHARLVAEFGEPLTRDPTEPPPSVYFPGCVRDVHAAIAAARDSPVAVESYVGSACRWQTARSRITLLLRVQSYALLQPQWSIAVAPIPSGQRFLMVETNYESLDAPAMIPPRQY